MCLKSFNLVLIEKSPYIITNIKSLHETQIMLIIFPAECLLMLFNNRHATTFNLPPCQLLWENYKLITLLLELTNIKLGCVYFWAFFIIIFKKTVDVIIKLSNHS